jgi:hypothetical protein
MHRLIDRVPRLLPSDDARREIERNRHCGKLPRSDWRTRAALASVVYRYSDFKGICAPPLGERTKCACKASGFCQNCGATSITTWYWLSGLVHRRHLSLTEGIVQRVVDQLPGERPSRDGRASIEHVQSRLLAAVLLIGVHIHQTRSCDSVLQLALDFGPQVLRSSSCPRSEGYIDTVLLLARPPIRKS